MIALEPGKVVLAEMAMGLDDGGGQYSKRCVEG
jgi:hypothetical protein